MVLKRSVLVVCQANFQLCLLMPFIFREFVFSKEKTVLVYLKGVLVLLSVLIWSLFQGLCNQVIYLVNEKGIL